MQLFLCTLLLCSKSVCNVVLCGVYFWNLFLYLFKRSPSSIYQSTTPSLSLTIWPRWVSRQFLTIPIAQTLLPLTFANSLISEAVVMRQLRRWKRLWRRSLTRSHKRTSMGPSRSCWNGTTSALQPKEITSKETRVSCVYYQ